MTRSIDPMLMAHQSVADGLDLLAGVFAGPDVTCPEVVAVIIPRFAAELAAAPEDVREALAPMLAVWAADDPSEAAGRCAALEHEYVRLFVNTRGGVAATPYQSVYEPGGERSLMGPPAQRMAARLRSHGLDVGQGEPPDHIAVELELLLHFVHSIREGEAGAIHHAQYLISELASWVPRFVAAVRTADPLPEYAAAAEALEKIVRVLDQSSTQS